MIALAWRRSIVSWLFACIAVELPIAPEPSGLPGEQRVDRKKMPTYKLTIEYEGTRYSGWQAQGNTPRTVQGRLISAAESVFGEADLGGAGRTDAGVHAAGQVAHLRIRRREPPERIGIRLNDLLPHDIHVLAVEPVPDDFHARHDAVSRIYLYQVSIRRTAFGKPFVWWIRDPLDPIAMRDAASRIAGRHDFSAFTDRRATSESKVVHVERVDVGRAGDLILIRIEASHFLWKMVRKLVAGLVEIGRGTMNSEHLENLLSRPGEQFFQPTAAPSGLFLEAVCYDGQRFTRPLAPIVAVTTFSADPSVGGTRRGR